MYYYTAQRPANSPNTLIHTEKLRPYYSAVFNNHKSLFNMVSIILVRKVLLIINVDFKQL